MLLISSWAWLISFNNLETCLSIACLLYLLIEDISTLLLFISFCIVLILSDTEVTFESIRFTASRRLEPPFGWSSDCIFSNGYNQD